MTARINRSKPADMKLAQRAAALLNEAISIDPAAVSCLIGHRVPCILPMAEHPTIQVGRHGGTVMLGMLGIINGICGTFPDQTGPVGVELDDDLFTVVQAHVNNPDRHGGLYTCEITDSDQRERVRELFVQLWDALELSSGSGGIQTDPRSAWTEIYYTAGQALLGEDCPSFEVPT